MDDAVAMAGSTASEGDTATSSDSKGEAANVRRDTMQASDGKRSAESAAALDAAARATFCAVRR